MPENEKPTGPRGMRLTSTVKVKPSMSDALNSADDDTKLKLKSRKSTSLSRALTKQAPHALSLVEMAVREAEAELPLSIRDFASAVFHALADSETETIEVASGLLTALQLIGHNTNEQALKDICSRFDLEFPYQEAAEEHPGSEADKSEAAPGADRKVGDKSSENKTKKESGLNKYVELETFVAILYSELIDQAQPADLQKSFGLFDRDGNGDIDMNEFEAGLMALGDMNPLDLEGRKRFLDKIDIDGDANLSSAELINWLANDTFASFKEQATKIGALPTGPRSKPKVRS